MGKKNLVTDINNAIREKKLQNFSGKRADFPAFLIVVIQFCGSMGSTWITDGARALFNKRQELREQA
eukprot:1343787-Rhodomonas_salina.1